MDFDNKFDTVMFMVHNLLLLLKRKYFSNVSNEELSQNYEKIP